MCNNIFKIINFVYSSNFRFIFLIELLLTNTIVNNNNLFSSIIYRRITIAFRRKYNNINININILLSCFLYYFVE